uniref:NADP-dependent oxidoreductase domain-containing protein n=1 Tax=Corethron hystrix TaxID=216773 RepID=A0A7S1FNC9_9STRA
MSCYAFESANKNAYVTIRHHELSPSCLFLSDGGDPFEELMKRAAEMSEENKSGASAREKFEVPNGIGFGSLAWGDVDRGFMPTRSSFYQGVSTTSGLNSMDSFDVNDLEDAYLTLLRGGISFADTCESYGAKMRNRKLSSEHLIGRIRSSCLGREKGIGQPILSNKFVPKLMSRSFDAFDVRAGSDAVLRACRASADRMEVGVIDLYQLSAPTYLYAGGRTALIAGLAGCVQSGLCRRVGVSNMNAKKVQHFYDRLRDDHGIRLATNQVSLSLVNRKVIFDGTVDYCEKMGVTVVAHTPLAGGLASGLYTEANPTGGDRTARLDKFNMKDLRKFAPIHEALDVVCDMCDRRVKKELRAKMKQAKDLAERNPRKFQKPKDKVINDVTPAQVSINWVRAKGAVPIPGIKNKQDANELLDCLRFELTDDEVAMLDRAADIVDGYRRRYP